MEDHQIYIAATTCGRALANQIPLDSWPDGMISDRDCVYGVQMRHRVVAIDSGVHIICTTDHAKKHGLEVTDAFDRLALRTI